jgi:predicted dehydrogenase
MMQAFVDASLRGHQDLAIDADFEAGLIAQAAIEAGLKSARSAKAEALALEYSLSV